MKRRFLLLQGPLSPLFARLGDRLRAAGCDVHRINLCFGDRLHWGLRPATAYRGRPDDWGAFVDAYLARHAITDLVVHGDRRPYHRMAASCARARGVQVIATELGYTRPDWMTIERDGTNAGSHFPMDATHIRRIAAVVPPFDGEPRYPGSFWRVAVPDVVYNMTNTLLWPLYPHYQRHTIYFPPLEYAAWIGRLATGPRRSRAAERVLDGLEGGARPFLFLMQLEGDFQIRDYSPFDGQAAALKAVIASFAARAPADTTLVVKAHPLDNGMHRWGRVIAELAEASGVATRVRFVDGGSLERMLSSVAGVVTINSSAGIEAMQAGRPTKVLGPAIYDIAGLTHTGPMDDFWSSPVAPDKALLAAFLAALAGTVQVRGSIYSKAGLEAAIDGMAKRILTNRLNAPDAFVDPPPRLARFRA